MQTNKFKLTRNGQTVNLLTHASAINSVSWSLPPGKSGSCPMATIGGVCGACFAFTGYYGYDVVQRAQWTRFGWWQENIKTLLGRQILIDTLTEAIKGTAKNGFFRIFDSGDFNSIAAIEVWTEIVRRMPEISFWVPTRIWYSTNLNWLTPLRELAKLPNITVKPSGINFDETAPQMTWLDKGTTVITSLDKALIDKINVAVCPKSEHSSSCEEQGCRRCWDKTENKDIAYLIHGVAGRHKVTPISEKIYKRQMEAKKKYLQPVSVTIERKTCNDNVTIKGSN